MPLMARPGNGHTPLPGQVWAADNGRYSAPEKYTDEGYLAWLDARDRANCLFATAPDVWGDAAATLALSAPLYEPIRALGYPVALVAQDGLEHLDIPWDSFDALFFGGSDRWRSSHAVVELAAEAKRRGKWVHMGRVNSLQRTIYAESIGCDSVDGTYLKHDPGERKGSPARWAEHVNANPSIWGAGDG